MNISGAFGFGPFEIGGPLGPVRAGQQGSAATRPADGPALRLPSEHAARAVDELVWQQLRQATAALRAAFGSLVIGSRPLYTTTTSTTSPVAAKIAGLAARLGAVDVQVATLRTNEPVNSATSTERASSASLGLDLTTSASQLSSEALGLDVSSPSAPSRLSSASDLGLDVTSDERASRIESTAEINPATTSYGSTSLTFTGNSIASTSTGTLRGVYTGVGSAAGATSLTVTFQGAATLSSTASRVRFEVRDQAGTLLFSYDGNLEAGQQVYLGDDIGLSLSFSAGSLGHKHAAATTVSHSPTHVDPSALFNASNPNLQPRFEGGAQVTAGSFTVNGTTIAVNADDSIQSVLARINASGASVTATFASDRITLTTTSGSEDDIVLGDDSSGFLAAVKLAGASTTRGNIRDDQQVLSKTTQFQGVTSGTFDVGGATIAIDVVQDTLQDVIERINAAGAGVTASFNEATDRIELVSTTDTEDQIAAGNDTSGFLAAAHLDSANTVRGNLRDDEQTLSKTSQFAGVSSGSFEVNGVRIDIDAEADTLQTVVQKINAAEAGVTASYDEVADRIELTAVTDGDGRIEVGADTTGLLAAAGLSSENTALGKAADDQRVLAATQMFDQVIDGSFRINGVEIDVRAHEDTLQDIVSKIDGAGAGVTARYDADTDRLIVTPDEDGATLAIEGDTSGFLAAARLGEGVEATRVDPDAAFNGSGADAPFFDPGVTVHAGAFTVNGVAIQVAEDDTINDVLAKITASEAGVTASFDSATETVTLVSRTGTDPITVGEDSSGFVAAVKLDASPVAGTTTTSVSPFDVALEDLDEYGAVTAGRLTVNGHDIDVDPATTTLRSLVSALDGVDGVSASLDDSTGRVRIASSPAGTSLTVADTSGVLASLGIAEGAYEWIPGTTTEILTRAGTQTRSNAHDVARQVSSAVAQLNAALAKVSGDGEQGARLRQDLEGALKGVVESIGEEGVRGIKVVTAGESPGLAVDYGVLTGALADVDSLEAMKAAVSRTLDTLTERVARAAKDATGAALPLERNQTFARPDQARLTADQAAGRLLLLPPFQPSAEAVGSRAVAAYNSNRKTGALDRATMLDLANPLRSEKAKPGASLWPPINLNPLSEDPLRPADPPPIDANPLSEDPLRPDDGRSPSLEEILLPSEGEGAPFEWLRPEAETHEPRQSQPVSQP